MCSEAQNCVHRPGDVPSDQIFHRLYGDNVKRELRMEQLRAAEAQSRAQELAAGTGRL